MEVRVIGTYDLAIQRMDEAIAEAGKDPKCVAKAKKLRQKKPPTIHGWVLECVSYWSQRVYEGDIGVDWSDAHDRCWRCGAQRTLQRCHIIAKQFGGSLEPSNIIPLCAFCHDEMPDVTDRKEVWRWISETRPRFFYGSLVGERALELCKRRRVDLAKFKQDVFEKAMDETGLHLMQNGSGCRIKTTSIAWAIEMACKEATDGR
jgi:5-methylcytosine-specific restriction endonuclease McrA